VTLAGALGWGGQASAAAAEPDRFSFSFSNSDVLDCGSFHDNFTDFFDANAGVFFNSSGDAVRVVIHWEHHSTTPTPSLD